jgi:hypothetical protein
VTRASWLLNAFHLELELISVEASEVLLLPAESLDSSQHLNANPLHLFHQPKGTLCHRMLSRAQLDLCASQLTMWQPTSGCFGNLRFSTLTIRCHLCLLTKISSKRRLQGNLNLDMSASPEMANLWMALNHSQFQRPPSEPWQK